MRVGIALLLLLTGMSIYGATFLEHREALNKVYSSWWFTGTLALTGINLIVCSLNRLPHLWKNVTHLHDKVDYSDLNTLKNTSLIAADGSEETFKKLEKYLRKKGFRTSFASRNSGLLLSADKGRFGHLGSVITHVSLVLILIAGLITWFIYAVYLHGRFIRGWAGRRSAWFAVFGFVAVLFTYIGVNILLPGLHRYR